MPITKAIETVLTSASLLAAQTTALSTPVNTGSMTLLALSVRLTFHGSAVLGATLLIYTSPDNTNWDTVELQGHDIPLTPGATVQRTVELVPSALYVGARVRNEDASQAVTTISVVATKQIVT